MPLDPEVNIIIKAREALGRPPTEKQTPEQARAYFDAGPYPKGPEVAAVKDVKIPGPQGEIPVRYYAPAGAGPFPVLVYFHGGGWVVGSIAANDGTLRHIVNGARCAGVSVGYRHAPEHKFPIPVEDCYAAAKWVAENAGSLNVDPKRVAIGGASAGGNLAAAVAQMARDRKGPALAYQVLVYPVIERDYTTSSYRDHGGGPLLSQAAMQWYWGHYLRSDKDALDPYAAPIHAKTLKGLAPALVITAECDPLHDEGAAYALRLKESGVPTVHSDYSGMPHGFFSQWPVLDKGKAAIAEVSPDAPEGVWDIGSASIQQAVSLAPLPRDRTSGFIPQSFGALLYLIITTRSAVYFSAKRYN